MTDIFTREIIKDALQAIGDEMFSAMIRTSMSPIIYETTDFAVGVTDTKGNLIAQGNGVAAFLATLDTAVQSLLEHHPAKTLKEGDLFITNNPYEGGGTHLSDVVIILPVFFEGELVAFTVNKAHWMEVGGTFPGSVSTTSTEIYQEGLRFSFLRLYDGGKANESLIQLIRDNVRLPDSTIGDMQAGIAAARVGAARITEIAKKYGKDGMADAIEDLLDYGERMTRLELAKLPNGTWQAEDIVEEDGLGNGPFTLKVSVTIKDDEVIADFTGTSDQAKGPINCSYTGLATGARTVLKAMTNPDIPANGGSFRPLTVICPPGTVISAQAPAPVSIYYEPLIAAIEVMWKALQPILPSRLPVGHQRTVGATFISGTHPATGDLFVMGEPLVGGWGATADHDGDSGQFCCGNGETYNIPVELAESRYGFQVTRYSFDEREGGAGKFRGGKGVVLDYKITADDAALTYSACRTTTRPWGTDGGLEGTLNGVTVFRADGTEEAHTMVNNLALGKGDTVRLVSATGGGYGNPAERPREAVAADLKNGFITPHEAENLYGMKV
ncbi:5-oxoprolinase [Kordiimonas sediminis]|uniref:5-oxoprolinase n=1 Tax=Kordiimonas sediminis TaxID=1735581 RepID=A0A919AK64_9PROT|nr:hydantoinase B/oxoprolinase family protein [Kordiimonas sediminis]GHF13564.1 5-oxoprolinase [Kordiimonas sediminis]